MCVFLVRNPPPSGTSLECRHYMWACGKAGNPDPDPELEPEPEPELEK